MTTLKVSGLSKEFRSEAETLNVLQDLNLEINESEDISIVGPSGCGKSTLLYILGTLDRPTSGSIDLDGIDPFALPEQELARFRNDNIGFVFQDHHLLPQLSVLDNVLLPALAAGKPDSETQQRARSLIESVGLAERAQHLPGQLSGGERQRVAVARAMLRRPKLLLADEPTGNLDAKTTETVTNLLFELPKKEGSMLVVVTHSDWVASQAQRRLQLESHQLREVS
ncbi:MAG: ABC transporter ATP-binding protein [Planctomycetota bacterium]